MADIKRYSVKQQNWPNESPEGNFVFYSDHLAAIKAAVAAEREACVKIAFEHKGAAAYEIGIAIRARGAAHD